MDEFDDVSSTSAFINVQDPAEAQRYYADAANIQGRLNDNPNLGPEPFELTQEDGPEFYVEWTNDRFKIILYGRDFMDDGNIIYSLEIEANEDEGEPTFLQRAREIMTAIRGPVQGARRRRRRNRKTKKASKKRRSTKRR